MSECVPDLSGRAALQILRPLPLDIRDESPDSFQHCMQLLKPQLENQNSRGVQSMSLLDWQKTNNRKCGTKPPSSTASLVFLPALCSRSFRCSDVTLTLRHQLEPQPAANEITDSLACADIGQIRGGANTRCNFTENFSMPLLFLAARGVISVHCI